MRGWVSVGVTDRHAINQFDRLFRRRFKEASEKPAGAKTTRSDAEGRLVSSVILSSRSEAVQLQYNKGLARRVMRFACASMPAYQIQRAENKLVVMYYDTGKVPSLETQLDKVVTLPTSLGELVSYGYVVDDVVTTIVTSTSFGLTRADSMMVYDHSVFPAVLDGYTLPSELRVGEAWADCVWELIRCGMLVNISGRILALSNQRTETEDGRDFLFWQADEIVPRIVPAKWYRRIS
ncbi:hypothetical protein CR983_00390 [Candidatus Saccharibacteria bacterium]|nr:MAG: hypothetical protein CR983_00390 [Candidatus Saccharibacteria bacterium]